jgi:hypothetical protein
MQRAMCIWIPDWPLQRLALERADLHDRMVVLYEASSQGGLKVVAATAALGRDNHAVNFTAGIYPGMPLAEAAALVAAQRSTEPHLEPADPEGDLLALAQLAEWCGRFSPITGVEDAPRPDCLLLDVTGLASLFGGERALAEEVVHAFAKRGLTVRVAVADTIGAAWAAVHAETLDVGDVTPKGPNSSSRERSSRFERTGISDPEGVKPGEGVTPSGSESDILAASGGVAAGYSSATPSALMQRVPLLHILPAGETLSALAPLPIGYLRIAEETVALLATLGITRVGQLAALPRSALLARFGPELLRRFDQAIGCAPETIEARRAPPEYAADFTFEAPLANREAIEQVLGQLIAQVTEPLSRRRQGVLRLVCRLKYERAFEEDRPGGPKGNSPGRKAGDSRIPILQRPGGPTQATRNVPVLRTFSNVSNGMSPPLRVGLLPAGPPGLNSPGRISSLVFTLGLFRPSASPEYLRDLLRLRLENVRMAGPVTSVQVEVTSIGQLELRQQAMFDRETNEDQPRRLAGLVDRLSNRLGRGAVAQVALLPDAQPEYTCVDVPLAGDVRSTKSPPRNPAKKRTKKNLAHISRYGLLSFAADERPLWLLPQPARIEVVVVAPGGAPGQFRCAGRSYSVAYAWGPERIETGWWRTARQGQESRKTFVRRDYYRVETTSGERFWIFRWLGDRQWFLQGRFD